MTVFCGLPAIARQLEGVCLCLSRNGVETTKHKLELGGIPSVADTLNVNVQTTEFFAKLMEVSNLKLCGRSNVLYALQERAKYTYEPTKITLANAYSLIWKRLPAFSDRLQQSAR